MPPLPPVHNVMKIAMSGHMGGGYNWANVFHMTFGGGSPTIADCIAVSTAVQNSWVSRFAPLCPAATHLTKVVSTDLTSTTAAEGTWEGSQGGTSSFNQIPASACHLVSKLVQERYRGGHPRSYQAIGGDGHLADASHWNSAAVTSFLAAWVGLIDDLITTSPYGSISFGLECAVSYYTTDYTVTPPKRVRRAVPLAYDIPANGYTGNLELASQRRRIGRKR